MTHETPKQRLARCTAAIEKNPTSASAHFNLGLCHRQAGRMGSAADAFRKATELDPAMAKAYVNLGGAYFLQWKFEEAVAANEQALEIDPNLVQAHFGMGQAMLYLKRPEDVVRCNRRVIEIDPQHGAAHYFLAVGLLAAGDPRGAREELSHSMSLGHQPRPEFLRELDKAEKKILAASVEAQDQGESGQGSEEQNPEQ